MQRSVSPINPFLGSTPSRALPRRVLQHDLDMYAAIAGQPATMPPTNLETAPQSSLPARMPRGKPWSPSVLAAYLGHLSMPRLAVRVMRPEVADWMRRLSTQALERLQEAQERLASSRPPPGEE